VSKFSDLDGVFQALGHPVRFAVMEHLAQGETTVSDLAEPFDMALPSFMRHLDVLEAVDLIRSHKEGRTRLVELNPKGLTRAEGWMSAQRAIWEKRLDQLDGYVMQMASNKDATKRKKKDGTESKNRSRTRKKR